LSTLQKSAIGAPLVIKGYLVPIMFGGITGLLINRWHMKLKNANSELRRARKDLETLVKERTNDLEKALSEIKTLQGIIPICSICKKVRDDGGRWNRIESYISRHSEADFSHGICPECVENHYPDENL